MKSKLTDLMILSELEDMLEDRQQSDRRVKNEGCDPKTLKDRRTGDRRTSVDEDSKDTPSG